MFIVFDAIDGAGKGAQRIEVIKWFKENTDIDIDSEEFPVHNDFYENVIHPALQEETTMNKDSWILSFLLDKTLQSDRISKYIGNPDNLFIADGYFTTTIAYQGHLMGQIEPDELLSLADQFNIPKPDLCVYIDVDPEIALKRKDLEEGHDEGLDMFEKSIEKQKKLREIFKSMANNNYYSKWLQADGEPELDVVTNSILELLKNNAGLNI